MLAVTVQGGTNAGCRIVRQPVQPWEHECDARFAVTTIPVPDESRIVVRLDGSYRRCPACGAGRPKG